MEVVAILIEIVKKKRQKNGIKGWKMNKPKHFHFVSFSGQTDID